MAAPLSAQDLMINDYEKTAKEYTRVARKMKGGDLSVTVLYIEGKKSVQDLAAQINQQSPQLSGAQKQRVAQISASVAPHLPK
ncbi:MAG: hypothetical protein ACR2G0_09185 [Chthoniobacterales bacterium]